jgi:predicted GH43/DUF377 family glycosyl hydrolase
MKKTGFAFLIICVLVLLVHELVRVEKKISSLRSKMKYRMRVQKIEQDRTNFIQMRMWSNQVSFPKELYEVPLCPAVMDVKTLELRNAFAPYNASILKNGDKYHLFFRYDVVKQLQLNKYNTYVGYAELDQDFHQTEKEIVTIDTGSQFSEDPRVIEFGEKIYLIYNDLTKDSLKKRLVHLASLDLGSGKAKEIHPLDLQLSHTEKNWSPFVYSNDEKGPTLHFEYQLSEPRRIIKMADADHIESTEFINNVMKLKGLGWNKIWGPLRGGTQAQLVDGQYLGFFHSYFIDSRKVAWYLMGAYTFEAEPPFRITSISPTRFFSMGFMKPNLKIPHAWISISSIQQAL